MMKIEGRLKILPMFDSRVQDPASEPLREPSDEHHAGGEDEEGEA